MNRTPSCVLAALFTSAALATADIIKIESRDGRTIKVTVLAVENESVRVKKADGKEFSIPLSSLSEDSAKRVKELELAAAPAEGELPLVKVQTEPLSPEESGLLESLYPALDKCLYAEMVRPGEPETLKMRVEADAILKSLAVIHGKLTVKDRCARLLAVIRHELQGKSVSASIGAASCLTQIKDSEATESMFQALEGNLSEAAELECNRGIGERCTGEIMDRVLIMFMSTDPKVKAIGGYTLTEITTKAQLDELREKAATVVNTAEAKDRLQAVYALTRNVK
ncbi:MAG: hypothetical protein RLZZ505_1635 [Verrucomicrobiota bacterium]|jgi:hypothetical protein